MERSRTAAAEGPSHRLSRRHWLGAASAAAAGSMLATPSAPADQAAVPEAKAGFPFCLNTSTIREAKLGIVAEVDLAADTGYDAIEPWVRDLQAYVEAGGSLPDLRKRIADHGLAVTSAIGFANWIVDDDAQRAAGLEQAKREMELVAAIGGTHIAAPPAGATRGSKLDLRRVAERYRALLEAAEEVGVIPQVELWGPSINLSRLGELAFVLVEAEHPKACVMPDVYHVYKGGSSFAGLAYFRGDAISSFHMNDYPADPPRETIGDRDRVYPGDGVAPLGEILRTLASVGFRGPLSLELFNPTYWKQDPRVVAATGLQKMKQAVAHAQLG